MWTQEILHRLSQLESQSTSDILSPNSSQFVYKHRRKHSDFFKSHVSGPERKKFLGNCPRNKEMVYKQSVLNKIDLSPGLNRSIDYFMCIISQNPVSHIPPTAIEFDQLLRVLLSDLASHVSQVRLNEVYKVSKIPRKAPQLLPGATKLLFDIKNLVEHVGTIQAWQKATKINKGSNRTGYSNMKGNYSRLTDNFWVRNIGKTARNPYQRLFQRFAHFGINKGRMSQEYSLVSKEIIKNRLPNESSKVKNSAYSSISSPGDENKHKKYESRSAKRQGQRSFQGSKSAYNKNYHKFAVNLMLDSPYLANKSKRYSYAKRKIRRIDQRKKNFTEFSTNGSVQLSVDTDRLYSIL
ncbi:hypothetical protein BB560_004999 [Smittium megazygosporum]|uniref:Uncharacterized protein n=1 Tax=Smittium megazygosporum TaxID=133381 RepID=A0A2T9Z7U7_9FUNG|nr:hypothetical protein BB560_004999 [Smittium megazygosporum]